VLKFIRINKKQPTGYLFTADNCKNLL